MIKLLIPSLHSSQFLLPFSPGIHPLPFGNPLFIYPLYATLFSLLKIVPYPSFTLFLYCPSYFTPFVYSKIPFPSFDPLTNDPLYVPDGETSIASPVKF